MMNRSTGPVGGSAERRTGGMPSQPLRRPEMPAPVTQPSIPEQVDARNAAAVVGSVAPAGRRGNQERNHLVPDLPTASVAGGTKEPNAKDQQPAQAKEPAAAPEFPEPSRRGGQLPADAAVPAAPEEPKAEGSTYHPLHRGAWIDGQLQDGDKIPAVVHNFEPDRILTTVEVDTEWMADQTTGVNPARIAQAYKNNKAIFEGLVRDHNVDLDPETFHRFVQLQKKTEAVLRVNSDADQTERNDTLLETDNVRLSEMVGKPACAETATVGKILHDRLNVPASLMAGVVVDDRTSDPEDHAFVVTKDDRPGSLIWDVNRPHTELNRYPRILRTDREITHETFAGRDNYVVPAKDVITGRIQYFGVGNPSVIENINFADQEK